MSSKAKYESCVFDNWVDELRGTQHSTADVVSFFQAVIENVIVKNGRFAYRLKGYHGYVSQPFPENFTMCIGNGDGTSCRMKANDLLDRLVSDGSLPLTLDKSFGSK